MVGIPSTGSVFVWFSWVSPKINEGQNPNFCHFLCRLLQKLHRKSETNLFIRGYTAIFLLNSRGSADWRRPVAEFEHRGIIVRDFWPITRYVLEARQDRAIVTIQNTESMVQCYRPCVLILTRGWCERDYFDPHVRSTGRSIWHCVNVTPSISFWPRAGNAYFQELTVFFKSNKNYYHVPLLCTAMGHNILALLCLSVCVSVFALARSYGSNFVPILMKFRTMVRGHKRNYKLVRGN